MKNSTFKVNQFYNKNQFVIDWDGKTIFQSYDSTIAIIDYASKTITFWIDYDYSKTTSKHLKLFLNDYLNFYYDSKKDLEKSIKDWFIKDFKVIYDENLR
jgi:hypothetical protein